MKFDGCLSTDAYIASKWDLISSKPMRTLDAKSIALSYMALII